MDELAWLREALADRRLDIVAKKTGLHPNTIADIRSGRNENPTLATLSKLTRYLRGDEVA